MKALVLISLALGLAGAATAAQPGQDEIVYVSGSGPAARLFVVREDGTEKRRLTSGTRSESEPAYSRDGTRIAFSSISGKNQDVYVMNADGSRVRLLTRTPNWVADASPSWSPDGRWIVFASSRLAAQWSRDGKRIVFGAVGRTVSDVYVVNADGSNLHQVTSGSTPLWRP